MASKDDEYDYLFKSKSRNFFFDVDVDEEG